MVVWVAAHGATTISTNISTDGTLAVTGASTLSSTLAVTGATTLTGLTAMNGGASTTALSLTGMATAVNGLGSGTTSPATEISAGGTGTTTLMLLSTGTRKGGCLQLMGPDGVTPYRMYVQQQNATTTQGVAGFVATFEAGSCK